MMCLVFFITTIELTIIVIFAHDNNRIEKYEQVQEKIRNFPYE